MRFVLFMRIAAGVTGLRSDYLDKPHWISMIGLFG